MKVLKNSLFVLLCLLFTGIADANTLRDRPATIFYPAGHYLEGYPRKPTRDMFGYDYQRHRFLGYFANVYLGGDGLPPYMGNEDRYYNALDMYGFFETAEAAEEHLSAEWFWGLRNVRLWMRWNDAWLSNKDLGDDSMGTEPDGNLDRHYGYSSYVDSDATLTQFQVEPIKVLCEGRIKTVYLYYYSRIEAVTSTDVKVDGIWYNEAGDELGPDRYGEFAKVQEYLYDPLAEGDPCEMICLKKRSWKKELCDQVCPNPNRKKELCWDKNKRPTKTKEKVHSKKSGKGKRR